MTTTKLDYETLCEIHGQELVDRQIELEARMASMGVEAYRKAAGDAQASRRESGTKPGGHLLRSSVTPVAEGIATFLEQASSGSPGRRHTAVKHLKGLDPNVLAFIALRVIIDGMSRKDTLTFVARKIAGMVEAERRMAALEEESGGRATYVKRRIQKSTSGRHRQAVLARTMSKAGIDWTSWSAADQVQVGTKLIDIVMETTGLVELETRHRARNRTSKHLVLTAKAARWLERQDSRCELMTPLMLPTIIQPALWTNMEDGGYHTKAVPQPPLVKTWARGYIAAQNERVHEMQRVYDAVNAVQSTPWRINGQVLEVLKTLWDRGEPVAKLPTRFNATTVPCPACGAAVSIGSSEKGRRERERHACFDEDEDVKVKWKRAVNKLHEENIRLRSKRLLVQSTLWTAEMFAKEEQIFFPMQLDFRGRLYTIPTFGPQGADTAKGLLEFATGKPITNENGGVRWLAIHGANLFGEDKVSLEDRVQWTIDNEELIKATAADPYSTLDWWAKGKDRKKPWQFLAWCFEWAEFLEHGEGFVSHIPVALDGSCSGIQHFSAMLRDEVGGGAVNLTPASVPEDIYKAVCDVVIRRLETMVRDWWKSDHEHEITEAGYAQQLLDLCPDRETTKRQVMTLVYGATRHSCNDYTKIWLKEKRGDQLPWSDEDLNKVSVFFGGVIWDSISEVVIAAKSAMGWLQDIAKVSSPTEKALVWTTPFGFQVEQKYDAFKSRQIQTKMGDKVVKLSVTTEDRNKIDKRRMAQGVSPNFVHSMDACHLMWTVWYAQANGCSHFSMIHDSFGVHASDTDVLSACIREAFVDMYSSHDVLDEFVTEVRAALPEKIKESIPPQPRRGSLALETVLESDFFFA